MSNMRIKKGDSVVVLSGKDRGKSGKVNSVSPRTGKAVVDKINMVKKHVKPSRKFRTGGIIDMPAPIDMSNLALICAKCRKITRISSKVVKGKKTRACKKCGEET